MAENEELESDENQTPTEQSEQANDEADAPDFTAATEAGKQGEVKPPAEQPNAKPEWDKDRQRIQQEIGNRVRPLQKQYDEQIAALKAEIARLASGPATPKTKDRLQELSELAEGTPVDPDESVPILAREVRELRQHLANAYSQIQEQNRRIAPAEQQQYERQWKSVFAKDNPDAGSKADEAYQQFTAEYNDLVGDGSGFTQEACSKIANRLYREVLGQYKTTAAPAIAKAPTQSPKGAQIIPQGSRKAVAARGTESDEIPDFHSSDT